MILNDDLNKYIPLRWSLIHPNLYELALCAVAMKLAQVAIIQKTTGVDIYWQRNIDDPQLELGL